CKLLQYMACSLPAIASPVGVNRNFIEQSGAAMAATSDDDWATAIRTLADAGRRRAMGERGRRWCEANMSVERWLPELDRLLRAAAAHPSAARKPLDTALPAR